MTEYAPQPGRLASIEGVIWGLGCAGAGGLPEEGYGTPKQTLAWGLVSAGCLADLQGVGTRNRLTAAGHAQLAVDVVDVTFHGTNRDHECPRDRGIGLAGDQEVQYLAFAFGEWFGERAVMLPWYGGRQLTGGS
jgi:hypothetical protein